MFLNGFIVFFCILISTILGYWVQDRTPPVVVKKVEVVPNIVPSGGVLRVAYEVQRERRCQVVVEQFVYDQDGVRFPILDEDYTSEPGALGTDAFTIAMPIPVAAREGRARYRGLRSYYCNPVHHWFNWPIVVASETTFHVLDVRGSRPGQ